MESSAYACKFRSDLSFCDTGKANMIRAHRFGDDQFILLSGKAAEDKKAIWNQIYGYGETQALTYLDEEAQYDSKLRDAWQNASRKFAENWQRALYVYSLDTIYRRFNEESQNLTEDNLPNFNFKGLAFFMLQAFWKCQAAELSNIYRGVSVKVDKIVPPLENGSIYCFGQVASASKNKDVAKGFTEGVGTLLMIDFDEGSDHMLVDMKEYSSIPEEDEVIVSPFCDMKVGHITHNLNAPDTVVLTFQRCACNIL